MIIKVTLALFMFLFSGVAFSEEVLNDKHSFLNETSLREVLNPTTLAELRKIVYRAEREKLSISISGGRHAMGGQQFGIETLHIDTRGLNKVLDFDRENGIVEVEAGIEWPQLIDYLLKAQAGAEKQWGIRQKQTGADNMTIGGSISVNAHGRGLNFPPLVSDIESLTLVNAKGEVIECSRTENQELFSLVVGGYGLFGVIYSAKLRLIPRQKIQRHVRMAKMGQLTDLMREAVANDYLYGDFQYLNDPSDKNFMRLGVLTTYHVVPDDTVIPESQYQLSVPEWRKLHMLSHTSPGEAFAMYAGHYLKTYGQIYWTDTHQLGTYIENYHREVDQVTGALVKGSEMITELYVPRASLLSFMEEARIYLYNEKAKSIYGTIRFIRRDDETFLAWAREDFACIIFNLHVDHSPESIKKAGEHFRKLIDIAIEHEGSYFLTYHRFANKFQVMTAYPQFVDFLRKKLEYDPKERFQSDWYNHYRKMFAEELFR